jgi:hypothetical protein
MHDVRMVEGLTVAELDAVKRAYEQLEAINAELVDTLGRIVGAHEREGGPFEWGSLEIEQARRVLAKARF